ncbi:MAG TPA: hypothetical protein VJP81_07695 [Candidatus Dormibacteraeota bacterium]|nr:hypothetical protein [Candidatus Dormibacteraeota bacterium]
MPGARKVALLRDEARARRLGDEARRRIGCQFISPCYLIKQAQLIQRLLAK